MRRYATVEKAVGETPLVALERFRQQADITPDTPLAYAGRLDPMASGKLLILIGEECKRQREYHALAKEYEFSVLLGARSDSGDVLGIISATDDTDTSPVTFQKAKTIAKSFSGQHITLPYPAYSSKTVQGKPLHTWAVTGQLDSIDIPTYTSTIHRLSCTDVIHRPAKDIAAEALQKVGSIPPVTDARKAAGNDFRRDEVRASWHTWLATRGDETPCTVLQFRCVCASGLYMRSVAECIARELHCEGLAFHIHRTKIGQYQPLPFGLGMWQKRYR